MFWAYEWILKANSSKRKVLGKLQQVLTSLTWWDVLIGPAVHSKIKTLDVEIMLLQIEYEVRAAEHNSH